MLRSKYFILLGLISGLLISCATTYTFGRQYATENVKKIVIGKTSEDQVRHFFGKPWRTGLVNGRTIYTYCYEEIVFNRDDSVERNGNTLVIEFDENQVVLNYYLNVPGKEAPLTTMMMHRQKNSRQQQEQVAWQNQTVVIQSH